MGFCIKFDTGNAAFEDDYSGEVSRILASVAYRVAAGCYEGSVVDSYGNVIGHWACD